MSNVPEQKLYALNWVDSQKARFSDLHLKIWNFAETGVARIQVGCGVCRSAALPKGSRSRRLRRNADGLCGAWGSGGPVSAVLPNTMRCRAIRKRLLPIKSPRQGLHPWAAGHTDPHSSLGITALAGVLAAKATMERYGIAGHAQDCSASRPRRCAAQSRCMPPRAISTTAMRSSSIIRTAFSTVMPRNALRRRTGAPSSRSRPESGDVDRRSLLLPRHSPHGTARCPGAIDALCLMYTTTKYTKEAMFPHTGSWTLNEFMLAGGRCDVGQPAATVRQIQYSWRSSRWKSSSDLQVLANNARHVAAMTGVVCRRDG